MLTRGRDQTEAASKSNRLDAKICVPLLLWQMAHSLEIGHFNSRIQLNVVYKIQLLIYPIRYSAATVVSFA